MEQYSNIIYFCAGALTMFLLLMIHSNNKPTKEELTQKKKWSKISKIEYTFDVDYQMPNEMTAQDMTYAMAEIMKRKIEANPGPLINQVISRGNYSISCVTDITFIHREDKSLN